MEPIVSIKNVSKTFAHKHVLENIDIDIPAGKIVGLVGKNGAGKTTLIKLMNGLLRTDSGKILIENEPVGIRSKELIAYLPERTYLDHAMKVGQVLDYFCDFYKNFDRRKAESLVRTLGLDEDMKIAKMSKGMQEKLQLILVMSRRAKLYILDEPLGGVDPATRDYILDTILTNFEEGASILLSTHLISDIERILDEIVIIEDGRVRLHEEADTIRSENGCSIDEYFRRTYAW